MIGGFHDCQVCCFILELIVDHIEIINWEEVTWIWRKCYLLLSSLVEFEAKQVCLCDSQESAVERSPSILWEVDIGDVWIDTDGTCASMEKPTSDFFEMLIRIDPVTKIIHVTLCVEKVELLECQWEGHVVNRVVTVSETLQPLHGNINTMPPWILWFVLDVFLYPSYLLLSVLVIEWSPVELLSLSVERLVLIGNWVLIVELDQVGGNMTFSIACHVGLMNIGYGLGCVNNQMVLGVGLVQVFELNVHVIAIV